MLSTANSQTNGSSKAGRTVGSPSLAAGTKSRVGRGYHSNPCRSLFGLVLVIILVVILTVWHTLFG